MTAEKKTRNDLEKTMISVKIPQELEKRKLQYDLMLLEGVLRAHVEDSKAVIIAKNSAREKVLETLKKFKPKVLKQESISYNEVLKRTFNA